MKAKKERNQPMREWPDKDERFSERNALLSLMQTLPEVDVKADEEWERKLIEYAPCLNFRR